MISSASVAFSTKGPRLNAVVSEIGWGSLVRALGLVMIATACPASFFRSSSFALAGFFVSVRSLGVLSSAPAVALTFAFSFLRRVTPMQIKLGS